MFSTLIIKNYFISRRMLCRKSGTTKTRQKVDLVLIGQATKHLINNKTKLRMMAHNFVIVKPALSHCLLEFQK
jgi:hypothetical protein